MWDSLSTPPRSSSVRSKDAIEKHLSRHINDLFDLEYKIILYDLTNTYFKGEKPNSQLVKFGRSKEKKNEAKLIVLALLVNVEGFVKYSSILEGNIADCKTLSATMEKLASHTCCGPAAVVLETQKTATSERLAAMQVKHFA